MTIHCAGADLAEGRGFGMFGRAPLNIEETKERNINKHKDLASKDPFSKNLKFKYFPGKDSTSFQRGDLRWLVCRARFTKILYFPPRRPPPQPWPITKDEIIPMNRKIQSKYMKLTQGAGKRVRVSHVEFSFSS